MFLASAVSVSRRTTPSLARSSMIPRVPTMQIQVVPAGGGHRHSLDPVHASDLVEGEDPLAKRSDRGGPHIFVNLGHRTLSAATSLRAPNKTCGRRLYACVLRTHEGCGYRAGRILLVARTSSFALFHRAKHQISQAYLMPKRVSATPWVASPTPKVSQMPFSRSFPRCRPEKKRETRTNKHFVIDTPASVTVYKGIHGGKSERFVGSVP